MSAFDAGSIEATLDVDRTPFSRGLDEARRQADEFSRGSHTTTLDVDTRVAAAEVAAFEQRLRDLRNHTVHLDIDTRVAAAELAAFEQRIREATRDRTVIIRTVNTGSPNGPGNGPGGGGSGGAGGAGGGLGIWGALIPLIGSILPAIVPLTTAAAGLGAALAGGFTMGALAIGSFAVVAKSDLTDVSTALKAVGGDATKLPAQLQPLGGAIEQLHFAFAALKNQTQGAVSGALIQGIHTLTSGMAVVGPLINATGRGLQMMFAIFQNFTQGPTFRNFVDLARREAGPALTAIGVIIVNIANAALRMFQIFNPILIRLGQAAENVSGKISDWSLNGGLDTFAKKVYAVLQPVENFLKALGRAVGSIWGALGTGGSGALTFLTSLLNAIDQLQPALSAIVQLFSPFELLIEKMLPTLVPFVNLLGKLAQAIIPLLNATVGALVVGLNGILSVLTPVVHELINFFDKIGPADKVLGAIVAGFIALRVALILVRAAAAANPVLLLLTALAIAAVEIVDHWKGFSQFWIKLWGDVERFFVRIWNDIFGFFKQYGALILAVLVPFIGIPLLIVQHWGAISRFFERIWNDVYGFFKHYGAIILSVIAPMIGLPLLIAQHWRQIVGWLKQVWDRVWADVKGVWNAIIGFFEKIPGWITGVFTGAAKWLLHAGEDILNGLWTGIKTVWATVIGFYTKVYSVILGFFASAVTWLLHAGESIVTGLWNGIKAVWNTVVSFFLHIGQDIINWFASAASWLLHAGESIISGLWSGIKSVWSSVSSFFLGIPGDIFGWFVGAINWLENIGEQIIQGLWNGIKRIWDDLTGWLKDAVNGITGIFKDVLSIFSPSRVMHQIGVYTMQGFHNGLRDTWEGQIRPYLTMTAKEVSGAFGGLGPNAKLTTSSSLVSAATLAVSSEAQGTTRALMERVDALTKAVAAIPGATGKAVGESVGDKFDKTAAKQTRDLVIAARTA